MRTRVVVSDQSEADFYDLEGSHHELRLATRLSDTKARLHDRDFKSDRPGRMSDHAPLQGGRRGATAHHGTDGERRPRKHEAALFAHRIVEALERAHRAGEFEGLVLMAPPSFLGLLRKAMPEPLRKKVLAEVAKDLMHQPQDAVRAHLPITTFHENFEL